MGFKKFAFIFFIFLIYSSGLLAQTGFTNKDRAIYIMDIAKYVKWDNYDQIKEFKIGVLDKDDNLHTVLDLLASERKTLQDKPVKVVRFESIDDLTPVQVIYLDKKNGYDIELVLNKTRGQHTLIISENYPFHKSMINFIVVDNRKQYELNLKRLEDEGLKVNDLFVFSAITKEADWAKLYEETERELEQEKIIVKKQKSQIEKQQEEIDKQLKMIAVQKLEIQRQKQELAELEKEIDQKQRVLEQKIVQVKIQEKEIEVQKLEIEKQKKEVQYQKEVLAKQSAEIKAQEDKIESQRLILGEQLQLIEKQKLVLYFFGIMLILVAGLGYFIYRSYKIKKEANIKLEEKNRKITAQKKEIEKQRDDITEQRDRIALQKKQITDSIYYAQRIQRAILPDTDAFREALKNFFILYKPKDIVSGDFYWETKTGDDIVVVAADCTGHGVPGAFMSMLGVTLLNDIVNREGIVKPDEILNRLRDHIITSLNQENESAEVRDGMDIAVCSINRISKKIQFAGANNPMILIRNNELNFYKGDKMPVAIYDHMASFTNKEVELIEGDSIYIFSDGYIDQFGGEHGKKFLRKRLVNKLLSIQALPMAKQREELDVTFEEWRGNHPQIDDVLLIGIRV